MLQGTLVWRAPSSAQDEAGSQERLAALAAEKLRGIVQAV